MTEQNETPEEKVKRESEEAAKLAKENGESNPGTDEGKGNEGILEKVKAENLRLEKNIKEMNEIMKKNEMIAADQILAGRSVGGESKKETEDEKWAREAKERYAGTGMDPTPDDSPTVFN